MRFDLGVTDRLLTVDLANAQYVANWDTHRCLTGTCTLDAGSRYRIKVLIGSAVVGSADVRPVNGDVGKPGFPIDAGAALTFRNGSVVPIRFWLGTPTPTLKPRWQQLSTGSAVPANVTYSTYVPSLDAVFAIVGAGNNTPFALWKFSLASNAWSIVPTSGFPIGQFRKLIYDAATRSFLTYWDGLGQAYRVPEAGGSWTAVGSSGNSSSYYAGAAFINPLSGKLMQFAGYGFFAWHNKLWDFSPSTGAWTLLPQTGVLPIPRIGPLGVVDAASARFYFTEGQGNSTGSQFDGSKLLDDVWRLDLRTGAWTNLLPLSGAVDNRQGSGMAFVGPAAALYRFGGFVNSGKDGFGGIYDVSPATLLNDVIKFDLNATSAGWRPVVTEGAVPGARYWTGVYFDALRQRLVVVGGNTKAGWTMDVWALPL